MIESFKSNADLFVKAMNASNHKECAKIAVEMAKIVSSREKDDYSEDEVKYYLSYVNEELENAQSEYAYEAVIQMFPLQDALVATLFEIELEKEPEEPDDDEVETIEDYWFMGF